MKPLQRKEVVIRALYRVGESDFARDFAECQSFEGYAELEHQMREKLKACGPNMPSAWTKAIGNAIVEAQLLPAIMEQRRLEMAGIGQRYFGRKEVL